MDWPQFWTSFASIAPWVVGGAGLTGLITTWSEGRQGHRLWLRERKFDAYAECLLGGAKVLDGLERYGKLNVEWLEEWSQKNAQDSDAADPPAVSVENKDEFIDALIAIRDELEQLLARGGTFELFNSKAASRCFRAFLDSASTAQFNARSYVEATGGRPDIDAFKKQVSESSATVEKAYGKLKRAFRRDMGV